MEEWRVKNSLDASQKEQSQGNMVARYNNYYRFIIIKAAWHWLRDNKVGKPMLMTKGVSQSRDERRNYPMNGAKTIDNPH